MPDIAHQHQRPALDRERLAVGRRVGEVVIHLAGDGLAALLEGLLEIALHQPEPVAIDERLVGGIDGSHRVLAVHDGGQRRFQVDGDDARGIRLARSDRRIHQDLDAQAVVLQ